MKRKSNRTAEPAKKAVNLSLSEEAIKMGSKLVKALNRPSLSNTVEVLIAEKAQELKIAA